jgi:hypothetical protein
MSPKILCIMTCLMTACGTIAGNPKRPTTPAGSPVINTVYLLPNLDLDVEEETFTAETAPLMLRNDTFINQKGLINAQGKRFQKLLQELNATSARLNKILTESGEDDGTGRGIRVRNQGVKRQISAKIREISKDGFGFEGVLCSKDKPLQWIRWTPDRKKIELWRDFSGVQDDEASVYSLTSRIRASTNENGDLEVDLTSVGSWSDSDEDSQDGRGLLERTISVRKKDSQVITQRTVLDRFTGEPPQIPEGDSYLVSRLYPRTQGKKGRDVAFVGYSKTLQRTACQDGFDENAPDLWKPDDTGPRFCMGHARDGVKIRDFDAFSSLVTSLEDVGLVRSKDLERIAMPQGLTCSDP